MDLKTERQGIYRTPDGLLVNKDQEALKAYKAKKQRDRKIFEVEADVASLKNDLAEIKEMIRGLACK